MIQDIPGVEVHFRSNPQPVLVAVSYDVFKEAYEKAQLTSEPDMFEVANSKGERSSFDYSEIVAFGQTILTVGIDEN